MGYEYAPPTYKLSFEDHEGLEVTARSMDLGDYMEFIDVLDGGGLTKESIEFIFGKFAAVITSWNLERDGVPVPVTVESLYRLHVPFVRELIDGWRQAMEGVDDPLEPSSDAGSQSVAGSIPMESLSASHAS